MGKDFKGKSAKDRDDMEEKTYDKGSKRSNSRPNSKRKGRGKRTFEKNEPEGRGTTNARGACDPDSANDPSWYAASPQLLSDAASLAYSNALGSKYDVSSGNTGLLYPSQDKPYVPGVMAIRYIPGPGISTGANSPVNIAARNVYSFVRHANSGHTNYDSPDLMLYLLAMDNAYGMWSHMVRAYGTARLYNQKNRYMPRTLLRAMGFDFDSIMANLANFRYYINAVANKLGALCVPTTMPYFMRHLWMNQNIFTDSTSIKAQIYLYTPAAYFTYNEIEGAGQLDGTRWHGLEAPLLMTYNQIVSVMDSMINALMSSEDINIMSGDIMKAYQGKVWKLEQIPEDYTVLPTYVPEVLSQIENLIANGEPISNATLNITQDTDGSILYKPTFDAVPCITFDPMINMRKDIVTPADTMVASRLTTATVEEDVDTSTELHAVSIAGSEIVTSMWVFSNPLGTGATGITRISSGVSVSNTGQIYEPVKALEPFDWHPNVRFYELDTTSTDPTPTFKYYMILNLVDFDNYTFVNYQDLDKMHTTALLSEFNVPLMGAQI